MIDWLREWWQRQRYRRWRRKWASAGIDLGVHEATIVNAVGTPKGTFVIDETTQRTHKDFEFALARADLSNLKRTTIEKMRERHVFADFLESRRDDDDANTQTPN